VQLLYIMICFLLSVGLMLCAAVVQLWFICLAVFCVTVAHETFIICFGRRYE